MDLLHIDLTSGEAELLKWGAAPSYLRCGDTVKKLGTASLPPGVGVGGDHAPERYRLSLRRGEMLVLVSDGAEMQRAPWRALREIRRGSLLRCSSQAFRQRMT